MEIYYYYYLEWRSNDISSVVFFENHLCIREKKKEWNKNLTLKHTTWNIYLSRNNLCTPEICVVRV